MNVPHSGDSCEVIRESVIEENVFQHGEMKERKHLVASSIKDMPGYKGHFRAFS